MPLFPEIEAQIDRNNYGAMLFLSKQVSLPKISLILQNRKSAKKAIYTLFARRPSNVTEENVAKTKALETAPIHEMKF